MEELRYAYKILVSNLRGKKPLGRPGYRYKNNIKICLRDIGWEYGV
jgi:hypothetical protein